MRTRIGASMKNGPETRIPSDPPGREPGEGSARHIATIAARLFATRGYDATSVREIVEAAGVTKPTLYYHFGSKEGLAHALLHVPMERMRAELRAVLDAGDDPVTTLANMLEVHFRFFREEPDRARFVYALFFGPLASGLAAEMTQCGEHFDRDVAEGVNKLVEAGLIDAARAEDFATAIRGLVVVYSIEYLYRGREFEPGLARRLVVNLLRGHGRSEPQGS